MSEIRDYTRAQVSAFVDAIDRAAREARIVRLLDQRAASAGKNDFSNYLKQIDR